jgi:hypothetical protein
MTAIATIAKSRTEEIRVVVETFKGRQYVDVRIYFEDDGGAWRPSKKGVALRPEQIGELIEALGAAARAVGG